MRCAARRRPDAGRRGRGAGVARGEVARRASAAEAAEVVRAARHGRSPRRRGTKLDWGGPPPQRCDLSLDTGRLTGVVEHAAGDLIVVVRGRHAAARRCRRRCARPGSSSRWTRRARRHASAARSRPTPAGPRRLLYGTAARPAHRRHRRARRRRGRQGRRQGRQERRRLRPRQALHRLATARSGVDHRVRLPAAPAARGARGSSSVPRRTARRRRPALAARSSARRSCRAPWRSTAGRRRSPWPRCSRARRPASAERAADAEQLLGDGATGETPPAWWGCYPWATGDVGLKLTVGTVAAAHRADRRRVTARADAVPRARPAPACSTPGCPATTDRARSPAWSAPAARRPRAGGHCVVLTAPAGGADGVDVWGPVDGLDLMRRVKDQFDPAGDCSRRAGSWEASDGPVRCDLRAELIATACTADSACRPARRTCCGARRWTRRAAGST